MKNIKKALITSCVVICLIIGTIFGILFTVGKPSKDKIPDLNKPQNNIIEGVYFASAEEETGAALSPEDMKGGGVYIEDGAHFNMDDGTIKNHEAYYGGAIYVAKGGTLTMTGGTIENNSSMFGGAIYVEDGGVANITGGTIKNNTSQAKQAAIYVESGAEVNFGGSAVLDNNQFANFGKTYINFYIDGALELSIEKQAAVLNLKDAPLTYAECNGYFTDEAMTKSIEHAGVLENSLAGTTSYLDYVNVYNVYTARATLENLRKSSNPISLSGSLSSSANRIVIPREYEGKEVTQIISSFAYSVTFLQEVFLPATVTSIPDYSFYGCTNLSKINLTDKLSYIGKNAFRSCVSFEEIIIPKSVTKIDHAAFYGCSGVKKLDLGNIQQVDTAVFASCSGLTEITFSPFLSYIGDTMFHGCSSLETFVIPETINQINSFAFGSCTSLKTITIPQSVAGISQDAFKNCSALTDVVLNNTGIMGATIFYDCTALTNVTIGENVEEIGNNTFHNCISLQNVYIKDVDKFVSINFKSARANPLYYAHNLYVNNESVDTLTINKSVIIEHMFRGLNNVKTINVISNSIGGYAFAEMPDLENINILSPTSGKTYIYEYAFAYNEKVKSISQSVTLEDTQLNCFYKTGVSGDDEECLLTVTASISSLAGTIGGFYTNSNISKVVFNGNGITIGEESFYNCERLKVVELQSRVSSFGPWAFNECTALEKVEIKDIEWFLEGVFENETSNPLYYAHNLYLNNELVENLKIDRILSISSYVFIGAQCLKKVEISDLVNIETKAFKDCTNLEVVKLNFESGGSISGVAFDGCVKLKKIYLTGVSYASNAFSNINDSVCIYSSQRYIEAFRDYGDKLPTTYYNVSEDEFDKIIDGTHVHDYDYDISWIPTSSTEVEKYRVCCCGDKYGSSAINGNITIVHTTAEAQTAFDALLNSDTHQIILFDTGVYGDISIRTTKDNVDRIFNANSNGNILDEQTLSNTSTWSSYMHYYRTISNVTVVSNIGAVLTGAINCYNNYSNKWDLVGSTTGHFSHISLNNISFRDLEFEKTGNVEFYTNFLDFSGYNPNETLREKVTNISVDGCSFVRSTTGGYGAVRLYSTLPEAFENVSFTNNHTDNHYKGIEIINGGGNTIITNNKIINATHNSISLFGGSGAYYSGTIQIEDNFISNGQDRAIKLFYMSGATIRISNNTINLSFDSDFECIQLKSIFASSYTINNNTIGWPIGDLNLTGINETNSNLTNFVVWFAVDEQIMYAEEKE